MSFFKKLFGQKKKTYEEDKAFTIFFEDALSRYCYDPEKKISVKFSSPEDNTVKMPPSAVYIGAYEKWKTIQSVWDQRGALYESLDENHSNLLNKWQYMERLIIDRYPTRALQFVKEKASEEDFQDVEFVTSVARSFFFVSNYDEAYNYSLNALKIEPNHKRAKIVLADALHMLGDHEKAHEIYHDILEKTDLKAIEEDGEINLFDLVSFHGQILHSSIYAISLLSDERIGEAMWNAVAEEFYHCPQFRTQHAFWLFQNGENLKGVAKLISTTQEFPQHEEAVINAHSTILQFREQMKADHLWQDELETLTKIIQENEWEFAR
ncbi:tetratricopeptide repeat protein [Kordia algicida OT-1]|uniref:Uncharacterized protein n=1 Tax=Kordia algicida OT-1 TaxID=391587 RepID=A9E468_9FLAO|nr:tetratricopeptide repeat protein [Kordia algicida]EDP95326.1 hypothetical protein KAOT1_09646 [Kordia algicida OT-1]